MAKVPVPGLELNQAKMDKISAALCGIYGLQPNETPTELMVRVTKQWWNQQYKQYTDQSNVAQLPPTPDLNLDN